MDLKKNLLRIINENPFIFDFVIGWQYKVVYLENTVDIVISIDDEFVCNLEQLKELQSINIKDFLNYNNHYDNPFTCELSSGIKILNNDYIRMDHIEIISKAFGLDIYGDGQDYFYLNTENSAEIIKEIIYIFNMDNF